MIEGPGIMSKTTQNEQKQRYVANGNEIIKTANHFVIIKVIDLRKL